MLRHNKLFTYAIIIFLVFITFSSAFISSKVASIPSFNSENDNISKIPIAYYTMDSQITEVKTRAVVDHNRNLHTFVRITYSNRTFIIDYLFNGKKTEIVKDIAPGRVFDTYETSSGIVLFYSFNGQFGQFNLYMFRLNCNTNSSETIKVFKSNVLFGESIIYNIQQSGDEFHLLFGEAIFKNIMDENPMTKVRHITVFSNGSSSISTIITDVPYPGLQSLHYIAGNVVGLYKYMLYPTRKIATIVLMPKDMSYTSNVLYFTTDYDVKLSVLSNNTLNLALVKIGTIYTYNFHLNDSFSFSNFTKKFIGMYSYYDFISSAFSDHVIFLFHPIPHLKLNATNTEGNLITEPVILDFNGSQFSIKNVNIPFTTNNSVADSTFVKFNSQALFIASISKIEHNFRIGRKRALESDVISITIFSNNQNISMVHNIAFVKVHIVSNIVYILQRYWLFIAIGFGVFALITALFFRKIKNGLKRLSSFLIRPVKPNAKKFVLIFINAGIFIQSAVSIPFELWKSNKKRALISIFGMAILTLIILSSTTILKTKQDIMVSNYLYDADLYNNGRPSVTFSRLHNVLSARWGRVTEYSPFYENFSDAVINEMLSTIASQTVVLKDIITAIDYSTSMRILFNAGHGSVVQGVEDYFGVSRNYSTILRSILIKGRVPQAPYEIMIDEDTAEGLQKQLNDTIIFYSVDVSTAGILEYTNMTVVGIYHKPTHDYLLDMCKKQELSSDLIMDISDLYGAITFNDYYLYNLKDMPAQQLQLDGQVQLYYDFSLINSNNFEQLLADFNTIRPGYSHQVKFDPLGGNWVVSTEVKTLLIGLSPKYISTEFLLILLSIPILYLAIFLIFETNALFSASFEEEIAILRSKGLSTADIVYINTFMKTIESFFATLLGWLGTLIIIKPLLKIDRLLSFVNYQIPSVLIQNFWLMLAISFLTLVVITLPLTIKMSQRKKEKARPKKITSFLKKIRAIDFITVGLGGAIIYGGIALYNAFSKELANTASSAMLMIFIYIEGIGIMVILLGIGLILKDIHSLSMAVISKLLWKMKKNIFSLSLIEVKSDISLFNNVFLTYLILIGITLPSFVAPITVQRSIYNDTYFMMGSDMYIKDWQNVNQSLQVKEAILHTQGVVSVANISQVDAMLGGRQIYVLLLDNVSAFYQTAFKPEKRYFRNWDGIIPKLSTENTMLVSSPFIRNYELHSNNKYDFNYNSTEFTIIATFDYFPIIYPYGPSSTGGRPTVVMSASNFHAIKQDFTIFGQYNYRLLIKLSDDADIDLIANTLVNNFGVSVTTAQNEIENMFHTYIPFYSSIVSLFVFSLLISLISIAFTSMSNPLKILQKRMEKHDILKKMGVPNKVIIQMSSMELFAVGVAPGIIIGGLLGWLISKGVIYIFGTFRNATLPMKLYFPPIAMLTVFIIIPALFFVIFGLTMKAKFAAYMPVNLE